ncbi:MAG: hypothetical protein ACKVQS_09395, partial [Fimbriimonadaceae bacterium]
MSLVGKVGRKRPRAIIAMTFVYIILSIGALTTLYPFATMMTTGFKGTTDQNDNKLVPAFWGDKSELKIKYFDDKYAGNASWMNSAKYTSPADTATIVEYETFLNQLPPDQWIAGFTTPSTNVTSRLNLTWQKWLKKKYKSVGEVNTAFTEFNGAFQQITPPSERLDDPSWNPKSDKKWEDWVEFKKQLPAEFRIPISANRLYQEFLRTKFKNQLGDVPKRVRFEKPTGKDIPDFSQARLTNQNLPIELEFYETAIPKTFKENGTIENQWRNWVASSGNTALKATETLPMAGFDAYYLDRNSETIKSEFNWRNYNYVLDYILINGRAVANTIIFCLLTILIQLPVNPVAAYALSRFP